MISNSYLFSQAYNAMTAAYAPYSHCRVGAALVAGISDDESAFEIYTGANIENVSYSASCCAERIAFYCAWMAGCRYFYKIAIVGGINGLPEDFCPPCGICRQTMREFCGDSFQIILGKSPTDLKVYTLQELLPHSFHKLNGISGGRF